jgi:hypothetical protein
MDSEGFKGPVYAARIFRKSCPTAVKLQLILRFTKLTLVNNSFHFTWYLTEEQYKMRAVAIHTRMER